MRETQQGGEALEGEGEGADEIASDEGQMADPSLVQADLEKEDEIRTPMPMGSSVKRQAPSAGSSSGGSASRPAHKKDVRETQQVREAQEGEGEGAEEIPTGRADFASASGLARAGGRGKE